MNDTSAEGATRTEQATASRPVGAVVTHVASQTYAVSVRGHELTVDQPIDAGGDNAGPSPVELFVVSFASCIAYYAGRFLQRHHLPDEHLRVEADFMMADDRPARVASIRIRIGRPAAREGSPVGQVRAS